MTATIHHLPVIQPQPDPVKAWAAVLSALRIPASALGDCALARAVEAS